MADKYRWFAQKDGQTIEKSFKDIMEMTGLSEYQVNASMKTGRRYKGWLIFREVIDYENEVYDLIDDENNVVFSGTASQIEKKFKFKRFQAKNYLKRGSKVLKKYRLYKHNDFEKPQYHSESIDIATMLKIHGNTIANGRTLKRTIHELKQMGIRVNIERSSHWRDYYILTRRDNAEARS